MFRLRVESKFSGAHKLVNYPGPCQRLHGHNWRIVLTVSSPALNDLGMVIDLMELKALLDQCTQQFDHRFLNEIPPFNSLNPTSENLAKFVLEWMSGKLPDYVTVDRAEVFENDDYCVTYSLE